MRLMPYLCLGATEIVNGARTLAYGANCLFDPCPCPALEDVTYTDPATDDAPWYDADHPESEDFWGLLASDIVLSPATSRSVTDLVGDGAQIGAEKLRSRIVEVQGWMVATTDQAMWYGERWLQEALRGSPCASGCAIDDLHLLPFCRAEDGSVDLADDFRSMARAALIDGPRFVPVSEDDGYIIQTAQFQLAVGVPWLYNPAERCLDAEPVAGVVTCSLTTPQWTEEGTFVIDITAETDVSDLLITGKVSLDGSCPVDAPGDSVQDCFSYAVASMGAGDRLVIDGRRRRADWIDASEKFATSALPHLTFTPPFAFPDVSYCTTVCLSISAGYGDATATVDTHLRTL